MKKNITLTAFLLGFCSLAMAQSYTIQSPDKHITLQVENKTSEG